MAEQPQSRRRSSKVKTWLWRVTLFLGLLVGLALVFNEQIKLRVIDHMTTQTIAKVDAATVEQNLQHAKATYNFSAVKALDVGTVGNAALNGNVAAIGKLAVPAVGMRLPGTT